MIINGVELECDVLDVTTLKAIKQGSERVANINKEIAPIQDEIEQIEAMCHRITPAPAGKTSTLNPFLSLQWDHPRTCGENTVTVYVLFCVEGSPPHLRGKHIVEPPIKFPLGITPAPAGKTCKRCF